MKAKKEQDLRKVESERPKLIYEGFGVSIMKIRNAVTILSFVLLISSFAIAQAENGTPQTKVTALTADQQKALLSGRLNSGAVNGTFDSFTSLLFSFNNIAMHTEDAGINNTKLNSPFPEFYKPTLSELFDTIALQTQSSWKYDPKTNYWVFAKPALKKPYSLTIADKWDTQDMGIYTGYKPATFPVGMDVYYYGVYSSDDSKKASSLWERVRNIWALNFASNFKRGVKIDDLKKVTVDGVEALYFEGPAPRPGITFREWALIKNGKMFVIISTLPTEDKQSVADVEAMVKSFRVAD